MIKRLSFLLFVGTLALPCMPISFEGDNPIGNVIAKKIGEGTADFLMSADSIVANLTIWENDSLPPKSLSSCRCSIIQYTLCQPIMYLSDKRVYSSFYADVRLVIYKGKAFLNLELDYNINKWRLLDENGKQICRYDLRNSELLSLIHDIWPESKNINIKYENFTN